MIFRLLSACLLLTLSLGISANPCALGGRPFPLEDGSGMGGTGLKTGEGAGSGMGGTGHGDGTGSGGTGRQAGDGSGAGGTGVVGVITGFGSVCVNGLEIHYDAKTPVLFDGAPVSAGQLAVGQMATVEAAGQGVNLTARQIQVQHSLIGRVQAIEGEQVKVWGQWVKLPGTRGLKSGDRIKVSGYRLHADSILATRIDPALPQEADLLSGEVESVTNGTAVIHGVSVHLPAGAGPVQPGKEIRAFGKAEGSGFRAERVEPAGRPDFLDKIDRLVIKDSIRPGKAGKVRVGVVELTLDAKTQVKGGSAKDLQPGQLVTIEAEKKNGRIVIDRIDLRTEHKGRTQVERGTGSNESAQQSVSDREATGTEGRQQSATEQKESKEDRDRGAAEKPGSPAQDMDERAEKSERAEPSEKAETPERPEQIEKPEKVEQVERVERIERAEKPEKLEKPERIEKPERVEKPERPERED